MFECFYYKIKLLEIKFSINFMIQYKIYLKLF